MKLKEERVSDMLWKLFCFSVVILVFSLGYLAFGIPTDNTGIIQGSESIFFFLKLLIALSAWGAFAILAINSINSAKNYEYELEWRERDLKWIGESILKLEELLTLPESELRPKIDQLATTNIKVDNASYQAEISTNLIPIEQIGILLEKSKETLVKRRDEQTALKKPRLVTFWEKILSPFLEKLPEPQNGY